MYLIRTYLAPSSIAGVGVFTAEAVKKGQTIWQHHPDFDHVFTQGQYDALPPLARDYLDHYATWENGQIYMSCDNDRYANHSDTPNVQTLNHDEIAVALEDMPVGTELTYNYRAFDARWDFDMPDAVAKPMAAA